MYDWQYTNPFFEEGYNAASLGKEDTKCPYDYLKYEDNEKKLAEELYRQVEWYSGFQKFVKESLEG